MSAGLGGLLVGAAFGVMDYLLFTFLAGRADSEESRAAMKRIARGTLITMPIAGFLIGMFLFAAVPPTPPPPAP